LMMKKQKDLDLVLFGATGFTGELVAEYLAKVGQSRWAIAGRSLSKLEAVKASLKTDSPPELLVADASDISSLRAIAARARVVATTVGPYATYGDGLVQACVENGTHYCDLTGEVQWMQRMIAAHHEDAKASGARIVHTCGFDSIPSDLGVLCAQNEFKKQEGVYAENVGAFVMYVKGGFSGGTVASIINLLDESEDRAIRRAVAHPYALNPPDDKKGVDGYDDFKPVFDATIGGWTAPFLMASVNTRVVRRSHALLGHPYGENFGYREKTYMGEGLKGRVAAYGLTAAMGGGVAALAFGPTRTLAQKTVLPAQGEGPSREKIDSGGFLIRVVAHTGTVAHSVDVKATSDPGYGATCIMLAEAARCLAYDDLKTPAGVLTPSVAMGEYLVARLNEAGVTFKVRD
jgi:short subunit dehydrogenase-like uncharacterized protein